MGGVTILDYLVIASYFAGMLGVGWWGLRRSRNKEDYLVAGRRLGPVFYTGTLAAVVLGGASTIGSASLGYEYGISGLWLAAMLGLGILVLSVALSRRLSRLGVYTVAEMLELRYDAAGRIISGIIMIVYDLMVAVTATLAVGTLFDVLLGIPRVPAILVGGGVVIYTVLGGMWSITLTDLLQFVIMTVGIFAFLLPLSIANAGGMSGLRQALPASYFDITAIGGGTIFTYFLVYFFGMLIGQDIWQRVFTARTEGVARNAGVAAGLYVAIYGTAAAVIGMAAEVLFPGLENSDDAFATVAQSVLPAGLRGLVLAAALAALMSTASATVLAASTIAANDIYARFVPKHSESGGVAMNRVFVLGGGVVVIVTSLLVRDVVGALTIAYNLLVGGVLVPIIGALFWRRANVTGALASMTVGSLTVVGLMVVRGIEANEPVYIGLTASVVVFVVGLLAPPTEQQQLATWEARLRGEGGTSSSAEPEHVNAE